jgi:hypothetical protein
MQQHDLRARHKHVEDAVRRRFQLPERAPDVAGEGNLQRRDQLSWVLNAYTIVFGALLVTAGASRIESAARLPFASVWQSSLRRAEIPWTSTLSLTT